MQVVTILRDLWRLRLLVAVAAALSLLVGLSAAFKLPSLETRRYEVGLATVRVLVDTPKSQVVEVAPKGSEALGVRANLIANLMVQGVVREDIAERAGIPEDKLEGIAESQEPGAVQTPKDPRGHVLTTRVIASTDGDLPIMEIDAQAPDQAGARKLAQAALDGLTAYLDSKAADEQVADASRLRVSSLGAPQAGVEVRGPGFLTAIVLTLFLFVILCAAILGLFAVIRAWKTMTVEEEMMRAQQPDRFEVIDGLLTEEPVAPVDADARDAGDDEPPASTWALPDNDGSEPRRRGSRRPRDAA